MPSNKNKNNGVLPLERDFKPSDLNTVLHSKERRQTDGTIEKTSYSFPIFPADGSPYCLIYCIQQFNNGSRILGWNHDGPKLHEKFVSTLEDSSEWNSLVDGHIDSNCQEFRAYLTEHLKTVFSNTSWSKHIKWLRNVKKPPTMDPQRFLACKKQHNMILPALPGAPQDGVTPTSLTLFEFKSSYHDGMPELWQDKFSDADLDVYDQSLQDIKEHMMKQHEKHPYVPFDKKNDNKNKTDSGESNNQRNNSSIYNNSNNDAHRSDNEYNDDDEYEQQCDDQENTQNNGNYYNNPYRNNSCQNNNNYQGNRNQNQYNNGKNNSGNRNNTNNNRNGNRNDDNRNNNNNQDHRNNSNNGGNRNESNYNNNGRSQGDGFFLDVF